jgi:hypothetical protein
MHGTFVESFLKITIHEHGQSTDKSNSISRSLPPENLTPMLLEPFVRLIWHDSLSQMEWCTSLLSALRIHLLQNRMIFFFIFLY